MLISDEHMDMIVNTIVAIGGYNVTVTQSSNADAAVLQLWPGTGKVDFRVVE